MQIRGGESWQVGKARMQSALSHITHACKINTCLLRHTVQFGCGEREIWGTLDLGLGEKLAPSF